MLRVSDGIRARRFPIVNVLLIAVNLAVWIFYEIPNPDAAQLSEPPPSRSQGRSGEPDVDGRRGVRGAQVQPVPIAGRCTVGERTADEIGQIMEPAA